MILLDYLGVQLDSDTLGLDMIFSPLLLEAVHYCTFGGYIKHRTVTDGYGLALLRDVYHIV